MKISAFYPNYCHVKGVAYAALSVVDAIQSKNISVSLMGIASIREIPFPFYKNAIPHWLKSIAYKLMSDVQLIKLAETRFIRSLEPTDIVYIWPPCSIDLHQKIYNQGHKVILEFVNTHQSTSKLILDQEYNRLGLLSSHGIEAEKGVEDTKRTQLVDYVFSCSPNVTKSLLDANVPQEKLLETTYGLNQNEIFELDEITNRSQSNEINAIFVGSIGVRKGPHLLLDYWCKSGVKGKLTLVGNIQQEMMPIIEPYLKRPDIQHIPYVMDLKPIYKDADIFMLPSLEEGSPLVTYLALGAGLPCLVSPMGAGGIVEHDVEGLIMDPHDSDAWVSAIRKVANDKICREKYAKNAHKKAPNYLWAKVGQQRAALIKSRLESKG